MEERKKKSYYLSTCSRSTMPGLFYIFCTVVMSSYLVLIQSIQIPTSCIILPGVYKVCKEPSGINFDITTQSLFSYSGGKLVPH